MENEEIIGVKGVWLPGEVAFNKELNANDMLVFWIVNSLDCTKRNCWASNEFIAELINVSSQTVSNGINKLKKLGYIEQLSFNGRRRRIRINPTYLKTHRSLLENYNHKISEQKTAYKESLDSQKDPYKLPSKDLITDENNNKKKKIKKSYSSKEEYRSPSGSSSFPSNKLDPKDPNSYSVKVQRLWKYWNSLSNTITHRPGFETAKKCLTTLNLQLSKHSPKVIRDAMTEYNEILSNEFMVPVKTSPYKVSLYEFFGFEHFSKKQIQNQNRFIKLRKVKSWFHECKQTNHDHLLTTTKSKDPVLTNYLKKSYSKKLKSLPDKLSVLDENTFTKAADLLLEFHKNNKDKFHLDPRQVKYVCQFSENLIEFLEPKSHNGICPMNLVWALKDGSFSKYLEKTNIVSSASELV